ncbi:hypothetical protein H2508_08240 [Parahaliea sp. F7430]|uniref:Secreted protein n=1 Tax=Sediminihaliea albiluteola TaxID=2758564 RepID=A0A7W2TW81_9GAMM|nr:DUF6746 family protein [Sediminihaliea albiluteola]MBA6413097.1 hypothetical protein [Sediminihaliea albiluteola]
MTYRVVCFVLSSLLFAIVASADDDKRIDHFRGVPAESLSEALTNLEEYNARLAKLLAQEELSDADMGQIHQLSYTLENALERIEEELEATEEALEAVHVASERFNREEVIERGGEYLERSQLFIAK